MATEAELYCIRKKIPIPLMQEVWGKRHGIRPWQVEEAAEEEWQAIKEGKILEPDDIDAGWRIMARAKNKKLQKLGAGRVKVQSLKNEVQILKEELAFAKLPWWKRVNWRVYK